MGAKTTKISSLQTQLFFFFGERQEFF